ncbi:carboxypeptidase regulatory-like domain-containing protein [Parasphingorhabdus pacifica]
MSEKEQSAAASGGAEAPPSVFRTLASTLWFPVFFVIGFLVCYLVPFHAPAPHNVPVAIVGQQAAATATEKMNERAPDSFDVTAVDTPGAAREAISDREVIAAYDPTTRELFTAGANGKALQQVLLPAFTRQTPNGPAPPTVVDLVPTATGDVMGTGLFYVVITMNLVGYIAVMMLLRATTLTTRVKLAALAGVGAFASVASYLVALGLDVITNHLGVLVVGFLLTQAVSWVTFGLVPWVKQFIPGVAMGLFVMLSIPSSGGAIPKEMVPEFFQVLHPIMPMGNAVEAMRGLLYFDGTGTAHGVAVLLGWLVLGAVLIGIDAHRKRGAESAVEESAVEGSEPAALAPAAEIADPLLTAPESTHERDALAGTVSDRAGAAIEGAMVTITDASGRQLAHVRTAVDGRYTVRELPERHVTVVVSTRGHRPSVEQVHLTVHGARQDFVLEDKEAAHATAVTG